MSIPEMTSRSGMNETRKEDNTSERMPFSLLFCLQERVGDLLAAVSGRDQYDQSATGDDQTH